jgi:cell division protein YceG involved in septum cleavage
MKSILTVVAVIAVLLFAAFFIHWEIERTKKQTIDKAKTVLEMSPDSAAKKIGQTVFKVRNFKNKVKEEIFRLEDSTQTEK